MQKSDRGFTLLELALAIAIGMALLASSMYMLRQHNKEARVQQSKMLLATLRTGLAATRYRTGYYPNVAELLANIASGAPIVTGMTGPYFEPVSGATEIYTTAGASNGGWYYNQTTGTLLPRLSTDSIGGEDAAKW